MSANEPKAQDAAKSKKKRATRRNFANDLKELRTYCQVSRDVLSEGAPSEFGKGQVAAFEKVLARMDPVRA